MDRTFLSRSFWFHLEALGAGAPLSVFAESGESGLRPLKRWDFHKGNIGESDFTTYVQLGTKLFIEQGSVSPQL